MNEMKRPLVCVVSDGGRLVADCGWPDQERAVVAHAQQAATAGADLFLVREPSLTARALERVVGAISRSLEGTVTRVLVTDRLDVALAAGAGGVHLKASSFPADRVRAIAPAGFLIGRAVHGEDEAASVARAGGVDYVLFGTVLPSGSKPAGHPIAGIELYTRIVERLRPLPVVAIGGIGHDTIGRLAGAPGIAAIRWFLPDADDPGSLVPRIAYARQALSGALSRR
jgi:thiamine-phosphate diphosphorylase